MAENAFIGKAEQPTDRELSAELGPAKALWDRLLSELELNSGLVTREWNSYSRKAGWSLRLKNKQRNIVYLLPRHGCFLAAFTLGDRAVQAARASNLPESVIQIIAHAKRYAEGTGFRVEIRGPEDFAAVKKLVAIKMDN